MPYYALIYDSVEDYATRRQPYREEHLGLVAALHARGEVLLAGALGDPPDGALLIFRSPSAAAAEEFAKRDPYVVNGLVTGWRVRPWNVVVGGEA
ncbi:MAG: hypothetical protein GEU82_05990 [Luteitalea sp.]|nr:hypothetical protein [Luteitalea sp.]